MPQDVALTVRDLLWKNWATSNPDDDPATAETFLPTKTCFTTREYASNPRRIHNNMVSIVSQGIKETPEEVGSIVMYKCEESFEIHCWAIAGIGDDFEGARQRAKNMIDSVDIILRLGAVSATSAALGIQFIRISPGWINKDELDRKHVFHKVKEAVAIYYRTDVQLPNGAPIVLPTFGVLQADIGQADLNSAG